MEGGSLAVMATTASDERTGLVLFFFCRFVFRFFRDFAQSNHDDVSLCRL